jgi:hypothetical protein
MRLSMIAAFAATAALCSACSPAVGSPEWCKQMESKMKGQDSLEQLSKLSQEEQQGIGQCMMHALSGALKQ